MKKRSKYEITMSSNPANVCRTPIYIVFLNIKHPFRCCVYISQISASSMQHAFWFSSSSRSIENIQGMVGFKLFRFNKVISVLYCVFPPDISIFFHIDFYSSTFEDNYICNGGRLRKCVVYNFFKLEYFASSETSIRCNDQLGL